MGTIIAILGIVGIICFFLGMLFDSPDLMQVGWATWVLGLVLCIVSALI